MSQTLLQDVLAMNKLLIPAPAHAARQVVARMDESEAALLDLDDLDRLALISPLTWCALHQDNPICLGGITAAGIGWMISTPELNRQKRFFLRQSGAVMRLIRDRFDLVTVTVDICYSRSTRWLIWLGFHVIGGPRQYSIGGHLATVQQFTWSAV